MRILKKIIPVVMMAMPMTAMAAPNDSIGTVIDEVVWVVGDEAILRSDVEQLRIQSSLEGMKWSGDPDCTIPEQIAVQKLFKHQAEIDSIEVTDADVAQEVEQQINYWLEMVDGSSGGIQTPASLADQKRPEGGDEGPSDGAEDETETRGGHRSHSC